jgi:hypothetical protein
VTFDQTVRVGEARPSQLLWSFGTGSIIDLPNLSVIVAGLDEWRLDHAQPIAEARLLAGIRKVLGPQVKRLVAPPIPPPSDGPFDPFSADARVGVPVIPFPRWLRCPICQTLAPIESGLFTLKKEPYRPDRTRYIHTNCQKRRNAIAVPARFLVACRAGHLDDFPWSYFVHRGPSSCTGALRFFEQGASLETADLWVKCEGGCGAKARSMAEAFGQAARDSLPRCRGRHPHLRDHDRQCDQPLRPILLGASNSWFAELMDVLAVPTEAGELEQIVADHWSMLAGITSADLLPVVVRALQQAGQLYTLEKYPNEEIWEAISALRAAEGALAPQQPADVKEPEWEVLVAPSPPTSHDFQVRTVESPEPFADRIPVVRLAERLRAVSALIGFSRVEPPDQVSKGEAPVERAPLSRKAPEWVPAVEVRGEGIFLRFDPDRVAEWEEQASVRARGAELFAGHLAWRAARRLSPAGFPGLRFVMLHSFAHLLLREFSQECGYGAASIRERIYASRPDDESDMAGILLYTAAPDSEGTLGGLVALGEPEILGPLIARALDRASMCASDPLCAEHQPNRDRSLHGAACHACLFVPETSCEAGNRFLDRALVIPTFQGHGAEFFDLSSA